MSDDETSKTGGQAVTPDGDDERIFMDKTGKHLFGLVFNRVNAIFGIEWLDQTAFAERMAAMPWEGQWVLLYVPVGQRLEDGDKADSIMAWVSPETAANPDWRRKAVEGFVEQIVALERGD